MRNVLRKIALGTAFLTCPCHIPIYIAIFGGTALGSFFTQNLTLALLLLTALFVVSLIMGLKVLKTREQTGGSQTP